MGTQASKLLNDVSNLPELIGRTGLAIAAAQKAFNLDYLESLERLVGIAKGLLGTAGAPPELIDQVRSMIAQLAPARYQFTETEIEFRADLSQSSSSSVSAGLGVSLPAVSVNAAFSTAFGYDYRAAARVRTVLHAAPADPALLQRLLERSAAISDKAMELPPAHAIDQKLLEATKSVYEKLTGTQAPAALKEPAK